MAGSIFPDELCPQAGGDETEAYRLSVPEEGRRFTEEYEGLVAAVEQGTLYRIPPEVNRSDVQPDGPAIGYDVDTDQLIYYDGSNWQDGLDDVEANRVEATEKLVVPNSFAEE